MFVLSILTKYPEPLSIVPFPTTQLGTDGSKLYFPVISSKGIVYLAEVQVAAP